MNVLLIGDIGWSGLYHLGDEAMSEAAIDMLRQRGIHDITLIAGEPSVATQMYGLPAVPRIGYKWGWSRARMEGHLSSLTASLGGRVDVTGPASPVIEAVAACDAIVIAGGGNLNSKHVHHLFERVSLVRIARHYGRPVFVTSQTMGPTFRPSDATLAREIIEYATCFGAREASTHALAIELGGDPDRVVHGLDDAAMLTPREADRAAIRDLRLPPRYIIGSLTGYATSLGVTRAEYHRLMADTLNRLSDGHDAEVVLVPHLGSFDQDRRTHDLLAHDAIVDATENARITSLPTMPARQVVALTEGAMLSLSTRYHPTVFGPVLGTPTVAITSSYYSAVRMAGALSNVGLGKYAMPADAWVHGPFEDVVDNLVERAPEFAAHMSTVVPLRMSEQSAWWDAIAASIKGSEWVRPGDLSPVAEFGIPAPWAERLAVQTRLSNELGRAQFDVLLHKQDLKVKDSQLERTKGRLVAARRSIAALRARRTVRAVDRIKRELARYWVRR
ncbi:hypothetical protein C6I20_09160 [Aeromicrobium sp. A1-2]|uniref:polysaccharide pyruvyl transferase family protein n=1 Tax=Aeromicrobium sp. A1-2 TaxID=2107713 RepID=UPI000E4C377F|nr:polysaccharide pyruvyl transferase family protein [Aeromicrobium sp. A1-2]AXT85339.1 hypothetical protein C6I20_09160 [Aeromicrobium sp. A1-2]